MLTTTAADRTWDYSHNIGSATLSDRGFLIPVAIERSPDGILFVLNRSGERPSGNGVEVIGQRIGMLTLAEEYLGEFAEGDFVWAVDLALDSKGHLYVTDEHRHTVSVYDTERSRIAEWGEQGMEPGGLNGPAGIATDADDHLYVVDSLADRVQRFTGEGDYLGGWGCSGSTEGQFSRPWGVSMDRHGDVYVVDWGNDRVQKFTPDGEFVLNYGGSNTRRRRAPTWSAGDLSGEFLGSLNHPVGVAIDSDGDVYVTDWGNHRVQIYEPDGSFITSLYGNATEFSKWSRERMDANPDWLKAMRRVSGQRIEEMGRFLRPTGIIVDDRDRVIIAEAHHYRLQVYDKVKDYVEPQFNL